MVIIRYENLKIIIKNSELKKHLKADKKNILNNQVRIILPTTLEKSLWVSNEVKAYYGLNYYDIDISLCLNYFDALRDFEELKFI